MESIDSRVRDEIRLPFGQDEFGYGSQKPEIGIGIPRLEIDFENRARPEVDLGERLPDGSHDYLSWRCLTTVILPQYRCGGAIIISDRQPMTIILPHTRLPGGGDLHDISKIDRYGNIYEDHTTGRMPGGKEWHSPTRKEQW